MKSSSVLLAASAAVFAVTLSACDGLKEAMTAHVGTVARAGSQELSVDHLVTLMDAAKVPPRKEVASAIANVWLDYQLLGQSAAKGDTVIAPATIDSAAWAQLAGLKARRYYDMVSKSWPTGADEATARKMYDNGDVLAASHILLGGRGIADSAKPALKARATALRGQVNSGNFAAMATKNSQDVQSARQGGKLGIFRKGQMVPEFEQALVALKPGEISPVIETSFGYHIIRRPTFDEVKDDLMKIAGQRTRQVAESTFVADLERNGKVEMRSDAAGTARVVINDPDSHLKDGSTLATSTAGSFTAGRFAKWLTSLPPGQLQQQRAGLQAAPDSVVTRFVKQFAINEVVLKAADAAKVGATPEEMNQLHQGFIAARDAAWTQLGVDPASLAAAAKTPDAREKVAAERVDAFMNKLMTRQVNFAEVPPPVSRVLRDKADASVNNAGLDRAVEKATKAHAAADSTRHASQPASAVPMDEPQAGGAPPAPRPRNQ